MYFHEREYLGNLMCCSNEFLINVEFNRVDDFSVVLLTCVFKSSSIIVFLVIIG